ncbi:MAG: nucleoside hydrolase-like domain-containing protein [Bacteroidota bacterium]
MKSNKFLKWDRRPCLSIMAIAASVFVIAGLSAACNKTAQGPVKPRTIVTADPELDDNNSMIRFILHATDFRIDGLVYTSSRFHWRGDGKGTTQFIEGSEYAQLGLGPQTSWRWSQDERFINDILDAYEECYDNLRVHDQGYPDPEYLKSVTVYGNCDFEGDYSEDTDGSNLIKKNILDDKPGPLFLQAWGGSSSIAAALRSIEDEFKNTPQWESVYKKVCDKIVLCLSGDQDNAYNKYIAVNWPDAYVQNFRGGMGRYDNSSFSYLTSPEWTAENLRSGPIGALVRCWGDGKQMVPGDVMDVIGPYKGESVQELAEMGYILWRAPSPIGTLYGDGDSGCFFNLIGNGLRAWEDPVWGGWAGRWDQKSGTPRSGHPSYMSMDIIAMHKRTIEAARSGSTNDGLSMMGFGMSGFGGAGNREEDHTFPNMFPERNLAEAARMLWSVTPKFEDANHYPVLTGPLNISAKPGKTVKINATASDPDGDQLDIKWWYFPVGTYECTALSVDSPAAAQTTFTVPEDAKTGDTIHFVLQAADHGTPALTKYLRTIITVL